MFFIIFILLFQSDQDFVLMDKLCKSKTQNEVEKFYSEFKNKDNIVNTFYCMKLISLGISKNKLLLDNLILTIEDIRKMYSYTFEYEKFGYDISNTIMKYPKVFGESILIDSLYSKNRLFDFLTYAKFLDETNTDLHARPMFKLFIKHPIDFINILKLKNIPRKDIIETMSYWENFNIPKFYQIAKKHKHLFNTKEISLLKL